MAPTQRVHDRLRPPIPTFPSGHLRTGGSFLPAQLVGGVTVGLGVQPRPWGVHLLCR